MAASVSQLAQALAASLRQPPLADPTALLFAADDLVKAVAYAINNSRDLSDAASGFKAVAEELPKFTAALLRQLPSSGVPLAAAPKWTPACLGGCLALDALLMLLQAKALTLSDDGWTRLLTALVLPLKVAPPLFAHLVTEAQRDVEAWPHLHTFLQNAVKPFQCLLDMMYGAEQSCVPPRVASLLQATHFLPKLLCDWMQRTAAAALALMRATDSFTPPAFLAPALRAILATDHFERVCKEVSKRAPAQSAIVDFAARVLAPPLDDQPALAGDSQRCATLRDMAEALAADCLADARKRSSAVLLAVAANLGASPELQAQGGCPEQGSLLVACLELQAVLHHDCFEQQPGPRPLRLSDDQLRAMGCKGGLPLLCTLAAEVAAAAPSGGSSGGSSASPGGFGPWCWKEAARDWQVALQRWLLTCGPLITRGGEERMCDLQSCLGAWRATEALLRMLPALPHQPATRLRSGRWRTAAQDAAAAGGLEALREVPPRQHGGPMLALAVLHVTQSLLRAAVPAGAVSHPDAAQAAFELLSTMCRAVHSVAPALRPGGSLGGGDQSGLLVRKDIADLMRLLDTAAALALRTSRELLGSLPAADGKRRDAAERRLECGLLLYLSALEALLHLEPPMRDSEGSQRRCELWKNLLAQPELRSLWLALLGSAAPAACGTDVPWVLGQAMAHALFDLAHDVIESGRPLSLREMEPFEAPLSVLGAALRLGPQPALARRLAQHSSLLGMLGKAAAGMHAAIGQGRQRGQLDFQRLPASPALAALWPVARSLAPHLLGLNVLQQVALYQALTPLPSPGTSLDYKGLNALLHVIPLATAAVEEQQPAADAADAAEVAALALRRAHALALRRGCGNPRCASLEGTCEAEARGSRCSACRLLRFCGPACSKREWRWHKLACTALREAGA